MDDANEDVSAERVGAEGMRQLGCPQPVARGDLGGVVRNDHVCEERERDHREQDGRANDRAAILQEPPEGVAEQAARRPGERVRGDHERRMRGSRNAYETSTARLTTTYTTATKRTPP